MNIQWINKEKNTNAVTIYSNNITFSKQAALLFDNALGIAVGFDLDNKTLVMRKVTKDDILRKVVEKEDVYELTMKPSFGRINNKKLILELEKHLNLDFNIQTSYKFAAKWNTGLKMLIVDNRRFRNYILRYFFNNFLCCTWSNNFSNSDSSYGNGSNYQSNWI